MKSRILNNEKMGLYITDLISSIYRLRYENEENIVTWDLFISDLTLHDKDISDFEYFDTGAIALAISTIAKDSDNPNYNNTMQKACIFLKQLMNKDGSWSSIADLSEMQKTGCIYNTVASIEAIIDAGYFNAANTAPEYIKINIEEVKKNLSWVYSNRILVNNSKYYGWGYTGEPQGKIFIMPTIHVLITLKKLFYNIAKSYPLSLTDEFIDNKTLVQLIDEIQSSLYSFRVSPKQGWGKYLNDSSDRVVYTLHALYALSYSESDGINNNISQPNCVFSEQEIHFFTDLLCKWYKKKRFDEHTVDTTDPQEYFDSFVESKYIIKNKKYIEINNHENYFEPLAIQSIITFVKKNKKVIKKYKQGKIFDIIVKLHLSLVNRIRYISIKEDKYTVVLSRRGLPSQSYPIYAINQTIDALQLLVNNKQLIMSLMKYRKWLIQATAFIIQVISLIAVNYFTLIGVELYKVIIVSFLAPLSECIKNWIIRFSEIEE